MNVSCFSSRFNSDLMLLDYLQSFKR